MIQTFWNVLAALPAPGGGLDEPHPVPTLALASLAGPSKPEQEGWQAASLGSAILVGMVATRSGA